MSQPVPQALVKSYLAFLLSKQLPALTRVFLQHSQSAGATWITDAQAQESLTETLIESALAKWLDGVLSNEILTGQPSLSKQQPSPSFADLLPLESPSNGSPVPIPLLRIFETHHLLKGALVALLPQYASAISDALTIVGQLDTLFHTLLKSRIGEPGLSLDVGPLAARLQPVDANPRPEEASFQEPTKESADQKAWLENLFAQVPALIGILKGKEGVVTLFNAAFHRLWGQREVQGKSMREAFPELAGQGYFEFVEQVYETEVAVVQKEYPGLIDRHNNGRLQQAYFDFIYAPYYTPEGDKEGILIYGVDVTDQVEARQVLSEREAYFRQMADSVPVMIWTTRPDGYCSYLNQPWYAYTGQSEKDALGFGWLEATHPDDVVTSKQVFLEANDQQVPFSLRYRLRDRAGDYRWFMDRGQPKFDGHGQFEGYVGVVIDVHEQQLSEERLHLSVQAGRVGLWEWDVVHNRATYSERLLELFGLEKQPYQGEFDQAYQVFQSVIYPPDWPPVNAAVETAFARQETEFYVEFRVVRPTGETGWIAERGQVIYDGQKPVRMNGSCIDITARKLAEQEIRQLAEKLAGLNGELAASNEELQAANEEIQAANEELSQANRQLTHINADLDNFVYTASHDLKAPISNIEGLLQVLERQMSQETRHNKNVEPLVKLLHQSVERFKATIQDLTEVARISKESQEDIARIDLAEVLGEVLLDLQPQIREAGADIDHPLHCPAVVFSRKNLKSLLYNLLSNALKYRSPERIPLVRVSCYPEQDYQVLCVEDNGLGFDMRQQDKLFALFKRLHSHVEGTGIGLYIVKKMLDNAGGKIQVESQEGVGSTFRVYIPR
jgi:PAS domain S-box-containing protein